MQTRPDRTELAPGLSISRLVCGLWQVADLEKNGVPIDPEAGADALAGYADAGFDTFDMADHYGSAEIITGRLLSRYTGSAGALAFTKWCPEPGPMSADDSAKRSAGAASTGSASPRSICCNSIGGRLSIRLGWTHCTRWSG